MTAPARIASLLASATEMLYGLGLGDRVVAVSHECDFPEEAKAKPRATYSRIDSSAPSGAIDDAVRRSLSGGEPLYGIDVELLSALQPDLIVTQAQCDVCAIRYADVLTAVRDTPNLAGARVLPLNPLSFADVLADIARVAAAAGVHEAGLRRVAELTARVVAARRHVERMRPAARPRVALIEWIEPLFLASNWMPELLAWAGGDDGGFGRQGAHSVVALWEDIRAFDPQVILVAPCGFDLARAVDEAPALAKLPGWRETSAAREGNVWAVDGNAYFNRSGPRLVESLEILAHLLHSERYPAPRGLEADAAWRRLSV